MLTQNGIDYICQNFGDDNLCCIDGGLEWYYTVGGSDTYETGATAQIVARLALGILDSLTMVNPARGSFTTNELYTANGAGVTLSDAQEITYHDNPAEDQWCYGGVTCAQHLTRTECESNNCYWWNSSCHDIAPNCGVIDNLADCASYGCFWYNNACHSDEQPLQCSGYTIQALCESNDCYWYNGSCHDLAPSCTELNNSSDCAAYDCYWYDNSCHSTPQDIVCSDFNNQSLCETNICNWWNYSCHDSLPTCEQLNNQADCSRYECYWYDESCHSTPQNGNGGDGYVCETYGNKSSCETAGCNWYKKYLWSPEGCHTSEQNMVMDYLPFILAGVGGIILIALASRKRTTYVPIVIPSHNKKGE